MTDVALTRAGTLSPIVGFLAGVGVSIDRVLARAQLPPWIMADTEALIPSTSTVRIFAAASPETGIANLGLTVGERTTIDNLGVFGRLIRSEPTLGAALKTAVRYSTMMTANRPLCLRPRGDRVDLCMTVADRFDPRNVAWQQDNHFCLALMIGTVRLAAGPNWRPAEVHLQTDEATGLRDAESLASARVAFRQPETMVAVPRALLAAPLPPFSATEAPRDVVAEWKSSAPARDFAGSIRQAVETLSCGEEYPSIRQTADFVGMTVRTLQRRLAAAGVSHKVLVAQTRFATAAAVLEQTNAKILDLALDLGYSDHANFTRAFRRWAGCSPQEYRVKHARRRRVEQRSGRARGGEEPPTPRTLRTSVGDEGIALATCRTSTPSARLSPAS
jgi:AraC-like DNA-binding protein